MQHELLDRHFYDIVLVSSLVVCVPFAMICAVAAKLWRARTAGLLDADFGPRAAFERWRFGITSVQDRRELRDYFSSLTSPAVAEPDDDNGAGADHTALVPSFRSTWAGSSAAVERDRNALGLELLPRPSQQSDSVE